MPIDVAGSAGAGVVQAVDGAAKAEVNASVDRAMAEISLFIRICSRGWQSRLTTPNASPKLPQIHYKFNILLRLLH